MVKNVAEQGNANAQYLLGFCYFNGEGVAEDKWEAFKLFRKALEQDDLNYIAETQYLFGLCYYIGGEGLLEDKEEAVFWFTEAAKLGNADAQYLLGKCFYNGEGVPKFKDEAVRWFQMAAEQGNQEAQFELSKLSREENKEDISVEDKTEPVRQPRKAENQVKAGSRPVSKRSAKNDGKPIKNSSKEKSRLPLIVFFLILAFILIYFSINAIF